MKPTLIILLAMSVTACTTVDYESPRFADQTVAHRSIAVLPFEMVLTGKLPYRLTVADIRAIEEQESLAFQEALYHSLLDHASARRSHPILIDIQAVATTNRILAEHDIGIRESWFMEPEELAEVLGVDAVVRTAVHKTRYLSNLESYGLDVTMAVLDEATEGRVGWLIPFGLTTTHTIWADSSLLDGDDGDVLWKVVVERDTDWTRPANSVIAGITRKLARKFPYRA